jgi:polar amino acid transport system substrate-binding protein
MRRYDGGMRSGLPILVLALFLPLMFSCGGAQPKASAPRQRVLLVGTTGDAPPYAFRRGDGLDGLEVDLARELGKALGRPVDLVEMPFEELLDSLLEGQVDLVMAGLTITASREVRVAFGEPYVRTTIAALIRRESASRFSARDAVCRSPIDVGIVKATTGEKMLREKCPAMTPRLYPTVLAAVGELRQGRIDAVVHDAPVLQWLQSQNEGELQLVPTEIADQRLAWAFRPNEGALRAKANAALASMRADGTLDQIVAKWIKPLPPAR